MALLSARSPSTGPVAKPLEPGVRVAVHGVGVDVARDGVDLLPRRAVAGAGRGGRAREVDRAEVVREPFERVLRGERDGRLLAGRLVPETEAVVEELPPHPAPLRDAVLREEVLADVVEDAVADVARRRPGLHLRDPVRVGEGRQPQVRPVALAPGRVRRVVPAPAQRPPLDAAAPWDVDRRERDADGDRGEREHRDREKPAQPRSTPGARNGHRQREGPAGNGERRGSAEPPRRRKRLLGKALALSTSDVWGRHQHQFGADRLPDLDGRPRGHGRAG